MTDNDFDAQRSELANRFASAGAEFLGQMPLAAAALAEVPNTQPQQYAMVGEPKAIRALLPSDDMPARRMRHGQRPTEPLEWEPSAIANKAAEEGGLPDQQAMFESWARSSDQGFTLKGARRPDGVWYYFDDEEYIAWDAWQAAIAADRASRQVANKAEVEPVAFVTDKYSREGYNDEISSLLPVGTKLYATPPATTGASTAPRPTDDELWDATLRDRDAYHDWADKLADAIAKHFGVDIGEHSNQNLPWSEALEAIENADPVGASTVLTDERIANAFHEITGSVLCHKSAIDFARAIEREVAAQAGQVAVLSEDEIEWSHNVQERLRSAVLGDGEDEGDRQVMAEAACLLAALTGRAPSPAKESK